MPEKLEMDAYIEPKPSRPDEYSPQKHKSGVMWLPQRWIAVLFPLSEHNGVCQRGTARRDVDGTTAGEVDRGKIVEPSVLTPCPPGQGTVDNCRPAEAEN